MHPFPLYPRLQRLLHFIRCMDWSRQQYVFLGKARGRFDYHNFQTRQWQPLVTELVEAGQISFYLSQYHCRHTWITEALNHLTVQGVSYLARASP